MAKSTVEKASARALLVDWANKQDNWVRAAVSDVLAARKPIADDRLSALYDQFLVEKELKPGTTVAAGVLGGDAKAQVAEAPLILTVIRNAQNVNALASGQEIAFNPRLTILFGENATGKSGYVRILKRLASVRSAEPILPNIHNATARLEPSAEISYQVGSQDSNMTWRNEVGIHPFTRIDVFDSRGILIHVDQELTYLYTPSDLALFRLVHQAIEQIKQKLEQAVSSQPNKNPFLSRFQRDTRVYPKIESLGAATDASELAGLANVTAEELSGLEALRIRVDALRGRSGEAHLQVANNERSLYEASQNAVKIVASFDIIAYNAALTARKAAEDSYSSATVTAFASESIPAVLGDAWKTFIQSGERYIAESGAENFPRPGARCIYCRQSLDDSAANLIQKYRDFCSSALKAATEASQRKIDQIIAGVSKLDLKSLRRDLDRIESGYTGGKQPVHLQMDTFLTSAATLQAAVIENKPVTASDLPNLRDLGGVLQARLREIDLLMTELRSQAAERKRTLEEESDKLRTLEARITLRDLFPEVKQFIDAAKWANKAGIIVSQFQRLFRSLTEVSKLASETLVNHDFEARFQDECKLLRAPAVKLDFPGRKGQSARRKLLSPDYKLSDILSEGEQKVIALADFIAEALLKSSPAPIVFDDPVNSLDYKRLLHVVKRIGELSKARQVIVFTHNIWFTTELLAAMEDDKTACTFYSVAAGESGRGIISKGTSPRSDSFSSIRGRLNEAIQNASKATGETQAALIERAYEYMRSIIEVIVEGELLQGVTQRYQPNVMMTRLPKIRGDRLQNAVGVLLPVFEKCCRYIASHSQPLETLNVRPSLEDLKEDWKQVQAARDAYAAK